jgi:hypothetical protein
MQPAIDRNTLESLIALGRQKGGLTNQDLEAALPTGSMSVEDIALVVLQLEEAGVPIDLDESLLTRHPQAVAQASQRSAEILPFPKRPSMPPKARLKNEVSLPPPAASEAPSQRPVLTRYAHWAVIGSILIVALAAAALIVLGH